jgi:UDP-glucose 4-epimerase
LNGLSEHAFAGKRVLITGGLGFIGSNLALRLAGLGADVALIDNLMPQFGGNRFNVAMHETRVKIHIADVRDSAVLEPLVARCELLFNLAGQTSHMDSMTDPLTDLAMNGEAQLAVLEACRRRNPGAAIVFASTRQVYGRPRYLPVDELHPTHAVDVNGVNKIAAESYHRLYDVPARCG